MKSNISKKGIIISESPEYPELVEGDEGRKYGNVKYRRKEDTPQPLGSETRGRRLAAGSFIFVLILILVLGTVFYLKFKPIFRVKLPSAEIPKEEIQKEKFPSERAGKFSVSGGEILGPAFEKELIVDPLKPKLDEIQKFSIWAKDPKGIKEVTGEIETDNKGKEKIEFKLVEGKNEQGKWFGSWQVKDVSSGKHYSILILAVNEEGKETKLNFPFEVQF